MNTAQLQQQLSSATRQAGALRAALLVAGVAVPERPDATTDPLDQLRAEHRWVGELSAACLAAGVDLDATSTDEPDRAAVRQPAEFMAQMETLQRENEQLRHQNDQKDEELQRHRHATSLFQQVTDYAKRMSDASFQAARVLSGELPAVAVATPSAPIIKQVGAYLQQADEPVAAKDIAAALGLTEDASKRTVRTAVSKLKSAGVVAHDEAAQTYQWVGDQPAGDQPAGDQGNVVDMQRARSSS